MTINTKHGNLLTSVTSGPAIIVHGCNAQGSMGAGFAKQVREIYPNAYKVYKNQNKINLGTCTFAKLEECSGLVIANAVTQEYYGREKNKRYTDYSAVKSCFKEIAKYASTNQIKEIHFPKIGAVLGGGDWKIISEIIDQQLCDTTFVKTLWLLEEHVQQTYTPK